MYGTPAFAPPAVLRRWRPDREALALSAVLAAMALVVLDAAMVGVSLPAIAHSLEVTPAQSVRVVSLYQTAVVMALLPCAALGESLGGRRIFLGGLALFTAAAALAAWAPSLAWLAAARFVQGLGAAAVMALGIALLREALPPRLVGAAIGWNALTVGLCCAAGPALAAMIVASSSWHWLFIVHLPLALAALLAGRALPAPAGTGRRPSWRSMALSGLAFASLIFGAEALATRPGAAAALLAVSVLSFSILYRREAAGASPLIPFDLLRAPAFRRSVLASICCFAGQAAGLLALPFYLLATGETALATGLHMSAWPAAAASAALVSGRLATRIAPSRLCAAGAGLLAAGLAGAALVPPGQAPLLLTACTVLCGLGFGLFQVPNNRVMLLAAPLARSAAAGGLQGTARLLGQACGAVVLTLLLVWAPAMDAPRLALAAGAVFALAAAAVSAIKAGPGIGEPAAAVGAAGDSDGRRPHPSV